MSRKVTRNEMINALIDDDIDTIVYQSEICYLSDLLGGGFKGYNNYTDKELKQEYRERLGLEGEYIKIVK